MVGGRDARAHRAARTGVAVVGAALLVGLTACSAAAPDADASPASSAYASGPGTTASSPAQTAAPGPTASPRREDDGSAVGDLVPGFPVDLLPLPEDAVILVTSAVPVGDAEGLREVSLNVRTGLTVEEVVTLYRDALVAAGFTETSAAGAPTELAAETSFTRSAGDELVSVGVLDVDGGRTVTIGGRVRTER